MGEKNSYVLSTYFLQYILILEGHYIDLIPSRQVERVFILRTHPDELKNRLTSRDYSETKLGENLESEIYGVCQMDAIDAFGEGSKHNVIVQQANVRIIPGEKKWIHQHFPILTPQRYPIKKMLTYPCL